MSSDVSQVSAEAESQTEEPYIPVEELAERLDLPLTILLRRIEAGAEQPSEEERSVVPAGTPGGDPAAIAEEVAAERYSREVPATTGVSAANAEPEATLTGTPDEAYGMFSGRVTRYERGTRGPRAELAGMLIDSRELVSGLLDRWERTLEQRIHVEQRQRFEAELNARQNLVKQLQLELQTARAEHAAYAADRERRQFELERQIADLQRELAATNEAASRRRGLFHRR